MKILSTLLFFALFTLVGCSADDLAGPGATVADGPMAVQASDADTARPSTWRASDRFGTITLFLDASAPPILGEANTKAEINGKGVITNLQREPIAFLVEGQHQRLTIELALLDASGEAIAKGRGNFSTDLMDFKVVFLYEDGRERPLEFSRL